MVRQDDGLRAVFPGDHDQDIAFMQLIFLVAFPPAEERKIEVRFPAEGNFPAKCLAIHAGLADRFPVAGDQIIAQPVQVAQRAGGLIKVAGSWTQSALSLLRYSPWASVLMSFQ